ncbi:AlpA family phage regulatory protein [Methylovulum sp.]
MINNKFPHQIKLGLRCVAGSSLDIQNWIDDFMANSITYASLLPYSS